MSISRWTRLTRSWGPSGKDESEKALKEIATDPTKEAQGGLSYLKEKANKWIARASSGGLPKQLAWFSLDRQFWPSVGYGMASNTVSLDRLSEVLQPQYYTMLPICGIIRSASKGIRQLKQGFYGAGFPHPGVECATQQLTKLLIHYGISHKLAVIELGLRFQPYQLDFKKLDAD